MDRCHDQNEEIESLSACETTTLGKNTLKCGKAAGVDNEPAELLTRGGQPVVDVLLQICNNYRTISLISHSSKVMLQYYN